MGPRPMPASPDLLNFMVNECDFKVEHADGSFMDHLTFCRDYCAHHYKSQSPTPLFIHSILGVGTNIFPMVKEKIPQLAKLVTPTEFTHIEAFPSILRIVNNFTLLDALSKANDRKQVVSGIRFHRLIDNEPLRLTGEQLWVHLNYQVIHTLDFLPVANWSEDGADGLFQVFSRTYDLLQRYGKLE